ncbi:hypothetical protein GCM10009780_48560 [Actinomadura alba]
MHGKDLAGGGHGPGATEPAEVVGAADEIEQCRVVADPRHRLRRGSRSGRVQDPSTAGRADVVAAGDLLAGALLEWQAVDEDPGRGVVGSRGAQAAAGSAAAAGFRPAVRSGRAEKVDSHVPGTLRVRRRRPRAH